jgi:2-succinyl-5-enolpyruvyl-6-hydroxy-3-cyclohexene-1-carboxylate synthase
VDQLRLYGPFVREFFELSPPVADGPALRHLRGVAARAVAGAVGAPAGPVHVNVPLDRPLEPVPGADDSAFAREHPRAARGRADGAAYVRVTPRRARATDAEIDALAERVGAARRPLLVAGPCAEPLAVGRAALRCAAAAGAPLLADPLSGARYTRAGAPAHDARALAAYDLFLREPTARAALAPDLVIRVGRSPTSSALLDYLADCGAPQHVVVDPSHRWKDHLAAATDALRADPADTLERLAERVGTPGAEPGWRERWCALEAAATGAVEAALGGEAFEGAVARQVVAAVPEGGTLFVSSSMPVREVDAFGGAPASGISVLGNRGASGIDGIVSTALGVAAGKGEPVVALLGDVALLHDSNGLLATREQDARVVFVVVNNDGGAIFHFLPIRAHEPHFTPLFATPHGLDPARVAALYGLRHERVEPGEVGARVRATLGVAGSGSTLLEVRTEREANRRRRDAVVEQARAAVAEVVAASSRR